MRVLRAVWPRLKRVWEFVRWTGDAVHAVAIAGWVWGHAGDTIRLWVVMAAGGAVTTLVWLANLYVDAPPWVLIVLVVVFLVALSPLAAWGSRRERARQDAVIEQRVTEAVAALPDDVRRQPVQGMTLLDRILQNLVAASTRDPNGDPDA